MKSGFAIMNIGWLNSLFFPINLRSAFVCSSSVPSGGYTLECAEGQLVQVDLATWRWGCADEGEATCPGKSSPCHISCLLRQPCAEYNRTPRQTRNYISIRITITWVREGDSSGGNSLLSPQSFPSLVIF